MSNSSVLVNNEQFETFEEFNEFDKFLDQILYMKNKDEKKQINQQYNNQEHNNEINFLIYNNFIEKYKHDFNSIQICINNFDMTTLLTSLIHLILNFTRYKQECINLDFKNNSTKNFTEANKIHNMLLNIIENNLIYFLWTHFPNFEESKNYIIHHQYYSSFIHFNLDTMPNCTFHILKKSYIYTCDQICILFILEYWINYIKN